MNIISTIGDAILALVGRKKLKKAIKEMRDCPTCMSCSKETGKIIEEKWCFQCYYDKSDEHH